MAQIESLHLQQSSVISQSAFDQARNALLTKAMRVEACLKLACTTSTELPLVAEYVAFWSEEYARVLAALDEFGGLQ